MTVIINGRDHEVDGEELTYSQVIERAYPGRIGKVGMLYLISYSYRVKNKGGTLAPTGPGAELEQGMIFNCHETSMV